MKKELIRGGQGRDEEDVLAAARGLWICFGLSIPIWCAIVWFVFKMIL